MADAEKIARAAGVIARSPRGRILMCRRTDGEGWAFPGGGIKGNESEATAAMREFWEETGYRLGSSGQRLMQRVKDGVDFTTFIADVEDEFVPRLNHEHSGYGWFMPREVMEECDGQIDRGHDHPLLPPGIMMADDARGDQFGGGMSQFREQDHPRGQPKNKGQFVEGAGGAGKVAEPAEPHALPSEPFVEPKKPPGPGEKALREQGKPRTPEEQKKKLEGVKATASQAAAKQEMVSWEEHQRQLELTQAKGGKEGKKSTRVSELGPAPEKVNPEALKPERLEVLSKIATINAGRAGKPPHAQGTRGLRQVGDDLVKDSQDWLRECGYVGGKLDSTNTTPEMDDALAITIATMTKNALKNAAEDVKSGKSKQDRSAASWYRAKMEEAIKVASLSYPEIAQAGPAQTAFMAALAITSQGETVASNARLAAKAYEGWKKNLKGNENYFNIESFDAKHGKSMVANFKKFDALTKAFGPENAEIYLSQKTSPKQLIADGIMKKAPGGLGMNTEVYGSAIFGAKIGNGFYQNLRGNFDPVTQDLWFTRSFGRLTGTLTTVLKTQQGVEEAYETFKRTMKEETKDPKWGDDLDLNGLNDAARERFKEHEKDFKDNRADYDSKKKVKPDAALSSQAVKKLLDGIQDQPGSPADREWRGRIVTAARDKLKQEGIDISNADLQATIWYPEKDLWKYEGSRGPTGGNLDYSMVFQSMARKKGVSDDDLRKLIGREPDPEPGEEEPAEEPELDLEEE